MRSVAILWSSHSKFLSQPKVKFVEMGLHILAHLTEMLLQYPHQFWMRLTRMFHYDVQHEP